MFKSENFKIRVIFASILILSMAAFLVDFGYAYNRVAYKLRLPQVQETPFRLGLDLLGGTHLVYQADVAQIPDNERGSAIEGVRDVIERRVNVFGVAEPNVQTAKAGNEHRIIVELAGVKDVNEAINMIGETPLLEFKEQNEAVQELTPEQQIDMDKFNKEAKQKAQSVLNRALRGEDFSALATEISGSNGEIGWLSSNQMTLEIYLAVEKLKAGAISKTLVEDQNGYNVIKLIDKRVVKEEGGLGLDKKEIKARHLLICYEGATACESGLSKDEARQKIEDLKQQATPTNFKSLVISNSTEPGATETRGNLGYFKFEDMVEPFSQVAFSQPVETISDIVETQFGFHLIYKEDERTLYEYNIARILVEDQTEADIVGLPDAWKNTQLTGKNLKHALVQFNPNDGSSEIKLEFDGEGKDLFSAITGRNVGKPVAIFLDGMPISIPTVNEVITSGDAVITGRFTTKESKLLAQRLNAGALPVPIELINQQTVGATLGKISVEKSVQAGIIGLILVAIFMIVFYRLPGILAVFSLAVYGLIILAVFKLWPITLTLSGLAGFILSVGMAVDANILIFARLREELNKGKILSIAINEAFRHAWPSIRDGNISTLLTCFVLINFTTSIVKGFAVTLALGVLVSMFSAIVITKVLMQLFISEKFENKKWMLGSGNK